MPSATHSNAPKLRYGVIVQYKKTPTIKKQNSAKKCGAFKVLLSVSPQEVEKNILQTVLTQKTQL